MSLRDQVVCHLSLIITNGFHHGSSIVKIGIVVNAPSPHQVSLLDALSDIDGIELIVVYAHPRSSSRTWGAPKTCGEHHDLPWRLGVGLQRDLARWVQRLGCDAWVVGSVISSVRTHVVIGALETLGVPIAFLGEPPRPRLGWGGWMRDQILRAVLDRCAGVVATGRETARRYQTLLGDDRPVTSVPYYVPLDEWLALPLIERVAPDETIRFVTLAQLIPRKGLEVLVDACRQLPETGWQLEVFGEGPSRPQLQTQIDEARLPITLHPPVAFARRTTAFSGRHCFVFPTLWDGWGMVVPEALSAGLPVIATDQAMAAYDFIEDGVQGWLGPAGDRTFLATKMQYVLDHRDVLPAMSRRARATLAGYRPEVGAARLAAFVEGLATGGSR